MADLAVMQMQDLLELGAEGRINTPSTLGCNWQWRLLPGQADEKLAARLLRAVRLYNRAPRPGKKRTLPKQAEKTEQTAEIAEKS